MFSVKEEEEIDYYHKQLSEMENCKQLLTELKKQYLKMRVKCAEMELKLCTSLDPTLIIAMRNSQIECENCIKTISVNSDCKEENQDQTSS